MNTAQLIDIAFTALEQRKGSPVRSSADKSYMTSHGQKDIPQADIGTADVGNLYPVTCRARYYDAASKVLEDELNLFTHDNANELGALIEQWIEHKR